MMTNNGKVKELKLKAIHEDGLIETIDLQLPATIQDGNELYRISCSNGMEYFFVKENGYYDGYGMSCPGINEKDADKLIRNIEDDRKFEQPSGSMTS